jgi:opacity protein-like surface antigen
MKILNVTVPIDQNGFNGAIQKMMLLGILLICAQYALAQGADATRKNGIKLDVTSHLLYRSAFILSYERVLKPNQTFAVMGGYQQFPKLTSLGSGIESTKDDERTGFKVGGEYRFYLKKENKYLAPHGVYIGPYLSYLYFKNERNIQVTSETGTKTDAYLKSNINVFNVGFQAGYQFVINDRFTIDLTFIGPSMARYGAKFQLDGNFDVDEEHEYQNEILKAMVDRFPMLDDLIKDKEVDANGKSNSWSFGYRYQVLLGYRFGHKK